MGTGALPPYVPSRPVPRSPTAASARPGQSGRGAAPGSTRTVVTEAVRAIEGTGRNNCTATHATAATTMTAHTIRTRDRSFRPPATARGRSPSRAPRRGSTLPPLAARGRNSLRRMTHHRNNARPPGLRGPSRMIRSRNSFTAGSSNVTGITEG